MYLITYILYIHLKHTYAMSWMQKFRFAKLCVCIFLIFRQVMKQIVLGGQVSNQRPNKWFMANIKTQGYIDYVAELKNVIYGI